MPSPTWISSSVAPSRPRDSMKWSTAARLVPGFVNCTAASREVSLPWTYFALILNLSTLPFQLPLSCVTPDTIKQYCSIYHHTDTKSEQRRYYKTAIVEAESIECAEGNEPPKQKWWNEGPVSPPLKPRMKGAEPSPGIDLQCRAPHALHRHQGQLGPSVAAEHAHELFHAGLTRSPDSKRAQESARHFSLK